MSELPDRGTLVWLEFLLQAGHEQRGRRPAIVLTTLGYHERSPLAVVCPITSQGKGWPMEVVLPEGLSVSGVVLVDQIRCIDREARYLQIAGTAPSIVLEEIDARLGPFLSL